MKNTETMERMLCDAYLKLFAPLAPSKMHPKIQETNMRSSMKNKEVLERMLCDAYFLVKIPQMAELLRIISGTEEAKAIYDLISKIAWTPRGKSYSGEIGTELIKIKGIISQDVFEVCNYFPMPTLLGQMLDEARDFVKIPTKESIRLIYQAEKCVKNVKNYLKNEDIAVDAVLDLIVFIAIAPRLENYFMAIQNKKREVASTILDLGFPKQANVISNYRPIAISSNTP